MKKLLIVLVLVGFTMLNISCAQKVCPTYDTAYNQRKALKKSKEIQKSRFCEPKKPKNKKIRVSL